MGDRLARARLDLIDRYLYGDGADRPRQAPPWTNDPAPPRSLPTVEPPRTDDEPPEVAAHMSAAVVEGSRDSLHRFHDTYDRIAGAAILTERLNGRAAGSAAHVRRTAD